MKITTALRRRDGSFPKLELPVVADVNGRAKRSLQTYLADEAGIYDVPDDFGAQLVASTNYSRVDGEADVPEAAVPAAAHVITCEDGETVNLDDMTRKDLAAFAADNFGLIVKANDNKGEIIAAIMAEVEAE